MSTLCLILGLSLLLPTNSAQGVPGHNGFGQPALNNNQGFGNRGVVGSEKGIDAARGALPPMGGGGGVPSEMGRKKINPNVDPRVENRGSMPAKNAFGGGFQPGRGSLGGVPNAPGSQNVGGNRPPFAGQVGQQPLVRKRPTPVKIAEHPDCKLDVQNLCSSSSHANNFAVLDCLQNDVKVGVFHNVCVFSGRSDRPWSWICQSMLLALGLAWIRIT